VTALPEPPAHLLTVAEYAQLGETTAGYTELHEGNLIMSPSSPLPHMIASAAGDGQRRATHAGHPSRSPASMFRLAWSTPPPAADGRGSSRRCTQRRRAALVATASALRLHSAPTAQPSFRVHTTARLVVRRGGVFDSAGVAQEWESS